MFRLVAGLWPIIALAFPLLELFGIVAVWHLEGAWTLAWLLLGMFAGTALLAAERVTFMPRLVGVMMGGEPPFAALKGSGLRVLAGLLLIFPGFISDALAAVLLLWSLLQPAPRIRHWNGAAKDDAYASRSRAANDDAIEGEYHRVD